MIKNLDKSTRRNHTYDTMTSLEQQQHKSHATNNVLHHPSTSSSSIQQQHHHHHRRKGSNSSLNSTVSFNPSAFIDDEDAGDLKFLSNRQSRRDHDVEIKSKLLTMTSCQTLSSVLNDPRKGSHEQSLFTKDWGYSFVEVPVEGDPVSVTRKQLNFMRGFLKDIRKRVKNIAQNNLINGSSIITDHPSLRRLDGQKENKNLERIPDIFLDKDFDLSNPETFNAVIAFSNSSASSVKEFHARQPKTQQQESSSSTTSLLSSNSVGNSQRTLSDILDVVEDNLSLEIALKFRDFFHIMNAMDVLMDEVSRTIKEVTSVRNKCLVLQESLVIPCLKNVHLTCIRGNCQKSLESLMLMKSLYQSNHSSMNALLAAKDYVSALTLISRCKEDLKTRLPRSVLCFKNLEFELNEREKLIEKFLQQDFNKMLHQEFLQPFSSDSSTSSKTSDEEGLCSLISGMIRVKMFNFVTVFQEEARHAVITVKKQTAIHCLSHRDLDVDFDVKNNSSSPERTLMHQQLKSLDFKSWLSLMRETFSNLTTLMTRVSQVNSLILRTLEEDQDQEEEQKKWTDLTRASLVDVIDFAESESVVFIESRVSFKEKNQSENHHRMTTQDFKVFCSSVTDFVNSLRSFSSSSSTTTTSSSLKGVLMTQANKFATRFHEERKKKLTSLLEIEQWKSMEVIPEDFQSTIDSLMMMSQQTNNIKSTLNGQVIKNCSEEVVKKKKNSVNIVLMDSGKEEEFLVVNSVVLMISLMTEYVSTSKEIPVVAADLLTRLVDLIKFFNNRSMRLVLGGEAKIVSGLKSVTSRVLINSSRAVTLIDRIIPCLKVIFDSLLTTSNNKTSLLSLFDDVSLSLKEHSNKITEKIINSNREFFGSKLSKWEPKPPVPSPIFQSITQHLSLLESNLEDVLPQEELVILFKKLDVVFKDRLRLQLNRHGVVEDSVFGPSHGFVSQELIFYAQTMNKKSSVLGKSFKFRSDDLWSSTLNDDEDKRRVSTDQSSSASSS